MDNEQWFLRDLRDDLRISQSDIAKAINVKPIKISNYERGTEQPTADERKAIVDFLVRRAAVRGLEILILNRK